MLKPLYSKWLFLVLSCIIFLNACTGDGDSTNNQSKKAGINEVTVHELSDPDKLNPFTSSNAPAQYMQKNIFMTLIDYDPVTYKPYGALAVAPPEMELLDDGPYKGGVAYTFEIRPEATWDNGTPITVDDYIFSVKAIKNPKVDAASLRPYYDFIQEVKVDPTNNRKFTVYLNSRYILGVEYAGYWMYPEYVYDPGKIMRKFSLKELNDPKQQERLRTNPEIVKFATEFNSEKFQRENGFVVGCGPYEFVEWKTGQYVELKKKENWWGDKVESKYFNNNPEKIIYTIVKDWTTAITGMKDEKMDLSRNIRTKDFDDLKKNDAFKKLYNLHSPDYMVYDYIGINMKDPKYTDKRVRQALNYLVDKKLVREVIMYGYAVENVGPIHPSKPYYNKSLKPYRFDVAKSRTLLEEAGWKDSDNNGIIDKVIAGKKTEFKTTIFYNQGNTQRENIAIMFKENAKSVGIDVDVQVREMTVMYDQAKAHNFELYVGGWAGSTGLPDFKQIWHTESYNGGSNYTGFGNAETDRLIESIRVNLDEASRTKDILKFQEILHEESPYIFLDAHKNRLAFHKRFDKANAYVARPGYNEKEWMLNPTFGQQMNN